MKRNLLKYLAAAAVVVGVTLSTQAIPITGNLTMFGGAFYDSSSVNTATTVTGWGANNFITSVNGFLGVSVGDAVTLTAPWQFKPSVAHPALWTVGAYTFDLTSSKVDQTQPGFLNIIGTGTISAAGFETTPFAWNFSSQDPAAGTPPEWSWSASTKQLPDGGMTAILLGAALSGLALLRRKLA